MPGTARHASLMEDSMELADHQMSRINVRGFDISEEVWHEGVLHTHVHSNAHLAIVFDGQVMERTDAGIRLIDGPSSVYFPAETCHALEFKETTTFISIDVGPERAAMVRDLFGDAPAYPLTPCVELLPLAARLRDELRRKDGGSAVALEGIALELIAQSFRLLENGRLSVPGQIREARRVIDELHATKLSLSDVASMVEMSPVRLAEGFRRSFDCTVGEYIRRKRVEHAIDLLVNSTIKLGDIALEAGFCDQPHLVRVFKAHTGMTPSRYRRAHLEVSKRPPWSPHAEAQYASA